MPYISRCICSERRAYAVTLFSEIGWFYILKTVGSSVAFPYMEGYMQNLDQSQGENYFWLIHRRLFVRYVVVVVVMVILLVI